MPPHKRLVNRDEAKRRDEAKKDVAKAQRLRRSESFNCLKPLPLHRPSRHRQARPTRLANGISRAAVAVNAVVLPLHRRPTRAMQDAQKPHRETVRPIGTDPDATSLPTIDPMLPALGRTHQNEVAPVQRPPATLSQEQIGRGRVVPATNDPVWIGPATLVNQTRRHLTPARTKDQPFRDLACLETDSREIQALRPAERQGPTPLDPVLQTATLHRVRLNRHVVEVEVDSIRSTASRPVLRGLTRTLPATAQLLDRKPGHRAAGVQTWRQVQQCRGEVVLICRKARRLCRGGETQHRRTAATPAYPVGIPVPLASPVLEKQDGPSGAAIPPLRVLQRVRLPDRLLPQDRLPAHSRVRTRRRAHRK